MQGLHGSGEDEDGVSSVLLLRATIKRSAELTDFLNDTVDLLQVRIVAR